MTDILFLAHRIPYPPNKGDKIRSFHLLRALAGQCRVHLGAFVDAAEDWQYSERLKEWCADVKLVPLGRAARVWRALRGLATGAPLSTCIYRCAELDAWVAAKLRAEKISAIVMFSAATAQYVGPERSAARRTIVDFVDVDSDKWRQYAEQAAWPLSWLYRREARTLLRYEQAVAAAVDASVFVSDAEAQHFRALAPASAARIFSSRNGVDASYFDSGVELPNPFGASERVIVFSGAMDYRANVDAVLWFTQSILPRVRARVPDVRFCIVGSRPARPVQRLAAVPGVMVTGQVPDVRPYLAHARVAVAPLRTARGVQNKVLEALAMNCQVVSTSAAARGLDDTQVPGLTLADSEEDFAAAVLAHLEPSVRQAGAGRQYVLSRYDWGTNLAGFLALTFGERPQALANQGASA